MQWMDRLQLFFCVSERSQTKRIHTTWFQVYQDLEKAKLISIEENTSVVIWAKGLKGPFLDDENVTLIMNVKEDSYFSKLKELGSFTACNSSICFIFLKNKTKAIGWASAKNLKTHSKRVHGKLQNSRDWKKTLNNFRDSDLLTHTVCGAPSPVPRRGDSPRVTWLSREARWEAPHVWEMCGAASLSEPPAPTQRHRPGGGKSQMTGTHTGGLQSNNPAWSRTAPRNDITQKKEKLTEVTWQAWLCGSRATKGNETTQMQNQTQRSSEPDEWIDVV